MPDVHIGGDGLNTVNVNITTHIKKHAPRQGLLLLVVAGVFVLFYDRISALDGASIWSSFKSVQTYQWAGALLATAGSFWAVGRYDAVVHRMLGTGTGTALAHRAGVAGIAISQTLGMGVFTGALVRWRMLPDVTLWQATRLSAAVALSFLAGWAVVTATALVLFVDDMHGARWLATLPIIAATLLALASLRGRTLRLFNRQISFPSLMVIASILTLTAIDTVAAAAALYMLLPETASLAFSSFYPAFLLALGAALLSGTPGGVGPFEVTLLALLPNTGAEPILGAVLAFRLVYYALPAILGTLILARGPTRRTTRTTPAPILTNPQDFDPQTMIETAAFAEANLIRQGGKMLLSGADMQAPMMVAKTTQAMISLRDPLEHFTGDTALKTLETAAKNQAKIPCLYKCSARSASHARRNGFTVLPIAREAWLNPRSFAIDTPKHRQLRRKLRKAKSADILTQHHSGPQSSLPLQDMAQVSSDWVARSGGERGFSMGLFTPEFVQTQRCYLARQDGVLQGFITLNTCNAEWSLDLMRQTADAPDGTMHALLVHALSDARAQALPRFSLAAIPFDHRSKILNHCVQNASGANGLRQFKASFSPNWQTLYMATPNRLQFCIAAFDIARKITQKPPAPAQCS